MKFLSSINRLLAEFKITEVELSDHLNNLGQLPNALEKKLKTGKIVMLVDKNRQLLRGTPGGDLPWHSLINGKDYKTAGAALGYR